MGLFTSQTEEERAAELLEYHNQGQEDDTYSPPHGTIELNVVDMIGSKECAEQLREDNEAYEKGHENKVKNSSWW